MCSKKQTSFYYIKLNQLEEYIKAEINVSNDVPNEFEDETEVKSNAVPYREKSPFGRHFEIIYRNTLVSISEFENNSQLGPSVSHNPQIVEFLPTCCIPLLPLWSGIILCIVNSSENVQFSRVCENCLDMLDTPNSTSAELKGCRCRLNNEGLSLSPISSTSAHI